MKLLHVISSLEIGGAQKLLSDLLPIQRAQGYDVSLLVNVKVENQISKRIKDSGVKILSFEEPDFYSIRNIRLLRRIFKQYDVVHAHLFPSLYWVAIASIGLSTKIVYTEHSTSNRRRSKNYMRYIEKFIYKQYDKIISISQQTQIALQEWLRTYDNRFVIINNGVDTQYYSSINLPVIPKSIIMVSRFVDSKDQATLIKAMQYVDPDAVLRLVGDGENMRYCKELVQQLGLSDRVCFLGARSDVAELISESYIGVQSSNWEGFGLTAVEMMSASKPVIASDVEGLKQIVQDAGEVFSKGDYKSLANKIAKLLDDRKYYETLAVKCQKRSLMYDIYIMARQYQATYTELMNF